MRLIEFRTIPHAGQRYETAGDYWTDKEGVEQFRVSYLPDWRHGFLIFLHEVVEDGLCKDRGINEEDIKAFDIKFNEEVDERLHDPDAEPGDDPRAPYYKEHQFATAIEKLFCHELGLNWQEYESAVCGLWHERLL
jgi:hypothetical protein